MLITALALFDDLLAGRAVYTKLIVPIKSRLHALPEEILDELDHFPR